MSTFIIYVLLSLARYIKDKILTEAFTLIMIYNNITNSALYENLKSYDISKFF